MGSWNRKRTLGKTKEIWINYERQVIIMNQYWFINCNKCTRRRWDSNRANRVRGMWGLSLHHLCSFRKSNYSKIKSLLWKKKSFHSFPTVLRINPTAFQGPVPSGQDDSLTLCPFSGSHPHVVITLPSLSAPPVFSLTTSLSLQGPSLSFPTANCYWPFKTAQVSSSPESLL